MYLRLLLLPLPLPPAPIYVSPLASLNRPQLLFGLGRVEVELAAFMRGQCMLLGGQLGAHLPPVTPLLRAVEEYRTPLLSSPWHGARRACDVHPARQLGEPEMQLKEGIMLCPD